MTTAPRQGDVWWVCLDPTEGGEIRKTRPALVLSNDGLHRLPLGLAIVAPLTTTHTGSALHVEVRLPHGSTERVAYALPEQVRSVSQSRLTRRIGRVDAAVVQAKRRRQDLQQRDHL
jgi:mRNA interferase MazF